MVVMERTPGFAGRNLAVAYAISLGQKRLRKDVAWYSKKRTTAPVVELQVLRLTMGLCASVIAVVSLVGVACPARPRGIGLGALKD